MLAASTRVLRTTLEHPSIAKTARLDIQHVPRTKTVLSKLQPRSGLLHTVCMVAGLVLALENCDPSVANGPQLHDSMMLTEQLSSCSSLS